MSVLDAVLFITAGMLFMGGLGSILGRILKERREKIEAEARRRQEQSLRERERWE